MEAAGICVACLLGEDVLDLRGDAALGATADVDGADLHLGVEDEHVGDVSLVESSVVELVVDVLDITLAQDGEGELVAVGPLAEELLGGIAL